MASFRYPPDFQKKINAIIREIVGTGPELIIELNKKYGIPEGGNIWSIENKCLLFMYILDLMSYDTVRIVEIVEVCDQEYVKALGVANRSSEDDDNNVVIKVGFPRKVKILNRERFFDLLSGFSVFNELIPQDRGLTLSKQTLSDQYFDDFGWGVYRPDFFEIIDSSGNRDWKTYLEQYRSDLKGRTTWRNYFKSFPLPLLMPFISNGSILEFMGIGAKGSVNNHWVNRNFPAIPWPNNFIQILRFTSFMDGRIVFPVKISDEYNETNHLPPNPKLSTYPVIAKRKTQNKTDALQRFFLSGDSEDTAFSISSSVGSSPFISRSSVGGGSVSSSRMSSPHPSLASSRRQKTLRPPRTPSSMPQAPNPFQESELSASLKPDEVKTWEEAYQRYLSYIDDDDDYAREKQEFINQLLQRTLRPQSFVSKEKSLIQSRAHSRIQSSDKTIGEIIGETFCDFFIRDDDKEILYEMTLDESYAKFNFNAVWNNKLTAEDMITLNEDLNFLIYSPEFLRMHSEDENRLKFLVDGMRRMGCFSCKELRIYTAQLLKYKIEEIADFQSVDHYVGFINDILKDLAHVFNLLRFSWKLKKLNMISRSDRHQIKYIVDINEHDLEANYLATVGYRDAFLLDITDLYITRTQDRDTAVDIIVAVGYNGYTLPKISQMPDANDDLELLKTPYSSGIEKGELDDDTDSNIDSYIGHMIANQEEFFEAVLGATDWVCYEGLCEHYEEEWNIEGIFTNQRYPSTVDISFTIGGIKMGCTLPLPLLIVSLRLQKKAIPLILNKLNPDSLTTVGRSEKWIYFLGENRNNLLSEENNQWPLVIPIGDTLTRNVITVNTAYHGFSKTFIAPDFIVNHVPDKTGPYYIDYTVQEEPWPRLNKTKIL